MTDSVADSLAEAEEYVTKFATGVTYIEERKGSASERSPGRKDPTSLTTKINLERLPLPSFDGMKKNYLRFKKEFSNHMTYSTKNERMMVVKSKCLTKAANKN